MAKRHWLDPLARQLLRATGQIPAASRPAAPVDGAAEGERVQRELAHKELVEQELLALKLQQNPALKLEDAGAVERAAALGWRLDVNRATAADWLRLPGIAADQVDLLLRLQAGGIQLSGPDDLQRVLDLSAALVRGWLPLLEFRWYGEPATPMQSAIQVDLNQASSQELAGLGLDPARLSRLLRERRRSPFRDLAELQQRLQFPTDLVESWIGKVSFRKGPAGPALPPSTGA
jgi:DNA uptake protein ComE-like DNA-binding protein